jgi:hypothetical protein
MATNSQSQQPSVAALLANAQNDGTLSAKAAGIINIADIGEQIQLGIGVDVNDVKASEVVLVTIMPDDSGSIRFVQGNAKAVRDGHNQVLDALGGSKQKNGILVHCRYLNGSVLYPFAPLDKAIRMDTHNYDPNLGTPLYDQTVVLLGTVLAKAQAFEDNGVPCRTVTLIVTDGNDESSRVQNPSSVRAIARDMLRAENHIIAGMGIDDGGTTDFRKVFRDMGLEDQWILTPSNSPTELRRAFNMFSQSAVRASQGGASFSQAAAGGFAD